MKRIARREMRKKCTASWGFLWPGLLCLALTGLLAGAAAAQDISVGPLVEVSRPNAVGSCNDGFNLAGTWPLDDAEEPSVAVNPAHPNNIVAAWIQGPLQDIAAGVSFDGGQSWQRVPLPFTICSGGSFLGTGDERLAFAQNGDLYAITVAGNTDHDRVAVSKSTDGGLHWSPAIVVSGNLAPPYDLPVVTPDPVDALTVYAIWDGTSQGHRGPAIFNRSTNGGSSWESPRIIFQTDPQTFVQFSQILVLPNSTLVDIFELEEQQPNKPCSVTNLQLLRSTDHGQTWSAPINAVTMTPFDTPSCNTLVVDPETGQLVADPTNPSFAVDSRSGNLYAVWEDGRFSNFQYNDIAFSMSADGGFTWSSPIRVNQTPLNIPPLNRQSFLPAMAVTGDGIIGVSYYDFRLNDPNPGLPTDRWVVQCQPFSSSSATDPTCWGNEVRLTNNSFNMEVVPIRPVGTPGFFLGDYMPLATDSKDFVAVFTQPDSNNVTSVFARRVGP